MTDKLQQDFANAVRAMVAWSYKQTSHSISKEEAAPFVASLPVFWHEPARIMATVGYYGGADTWLHDHAE